MKALTETGHIECEKRGGPGGYRYTVPRDLEEAGLGISLRPPGENGGDHSEDTDAEESSSQGCDTDEEGEEGDVSRAIVRNDDRAIESPVLQGEATIARSRARIVGE